MVEAETFNSCDNDLIPMPVFSKTFFCRFTKNSTVRMQSDHLLCCFLLATAL